jgi:hypothetical protein
MQNISIVIFSIYYYPKMQSKRSCVAKAENLPDEFAGARAYNTGYGQHDRHLITSSDLETFFKGTLISELNRRRTYSIDGVVPS